MTKKELNEIHARCEALYSALDENWGEVREWETREKVVGGHITKIDIVAPHDKYSMSHPVATVVHSGLIATKEKANFIAHARTDIPKLLAEIVRLRSAMELVHAVEVEMMDTHISGSLRLWTDYERMEMLHDALAFVGLVEPFDGAEVLTNIPQWREIIQEGQAEKVEARNKKHLSL